MAKKTTKKRNPQDVTVRNVRAGLRRDRLLAARLDKLEAQVARLERREGIAAEQ